MVLKQQTIGHFYIM